jgi:hypothetical protein
MSDNIQGFLSAAEGNALYCLARDFTPQENVVVVELGSWKGKSSVMIAGGLLAKLGMGGEAPVELNASLDRPRQIFANLWQVVVNKVWRRSSGG